MEVIAGPFAVAASLLALGGVAKVHKPLPTAGAVRAVALPGTEVLRRPGAVRVLGLGEVLVGVLALLTGNRALAAVVGAAYLAFAIFVVEALRSGHHVQSCGCLGETDVPPHWGHVILNVGLAATGLAGAGGGVPPLAGTLADQPLGGVPFAALCALSLWFAVILLTVVPLTTRARETTA
jgi:hypothetical protein